jgi:indoleamine 2,3-dioxygenase
MPVLYEGVAAYAGRPQSFAGASAAQGLLFPALDAGLGVAHQRDELAVYLEELHGYAPPEHRALLAAISGAPSVRGYVLDHRDRAPGLRHAYNECVSQLARFRAKHLEYTAAYLEAPARQLANDHPERGTGGTPFLKFLSKYSQETAGHLLS